MQSGEKFDVAVSTLWTALGFGVMVVLTYLVLLILCMFIIRAAGDKTKALVVLVVSMAYASAITWVVTSGVVPGL